MRNATTTTHKMAELKLYSHVYKTAGSHPGNT